MNCSRGNAFDTVLSLAVPISSACHSKTNLPLEGNLLNCCVYFYRWFIGPVRHYQYVESFFCCCSVSRFFPRLKRQLDMVCTDVSRFVQAKESLHPYSEGISPTSNNQRFYCVASGTFLNGAKQICETRWAIIYGAMFWNGAKQMLGFLDSVTFQDDAYLKPPDRQPLSRF